LLSVVVRVAEGVVENGTVLVMTAVALSNTYGLLAIAFLLGYGLMELPKQTWMVRQWTDGGADGGDGDYDHHHHPSSPHHRLVPSSTR
jgi:hypothetical protein